MLALLAVMVIGVLAGQCQGRSGDVPVVVGVSPVVQTEQGAVSGYALTAGLAYLGLAYAAPPVGELRWAAPAPAPRYNASVFNATSYGPACPQSACSGSMCPLDGWAEACLTLDVYTPLAGGPLPVMVFYPGGDFVAGGATLTLYQGVALANSSRVLVVVINYRLGALGFLRTRQLAGNYAVMDQTAALRWTRANIAAFGGDPAAVTIFGQSAGAMSVAAQLLSPPAAGLFHAAIVESNPLALAWSTVDDALAMAHKFAAALGCQVDDTACLRAAPVDAVLAAQGAAARVPLAGPLQAFVPWLPVVDGSVVAGNPLQAFASGQYNTDVPVLIGTVHAEGVGFVYSGFTAPVSADEFARLAYVLFGRNAPAVISQYPCPDPSDCRDAMSVFATNYIFACPTRNATRMMQQHNPAIYLYHFDHLINADNNHTNVWGNSQWALQCQNQICHSSELPFVFQSLENPPSPWTWGRGERAFAASVSAYWGNFANSRTPNGPLPVPTKWPLYTAADDLVLRMYYDELVDFPLEKGYLQTQCDFFDTIGYSFGTFNPQFY